jgi:hypothetical protein
MTTLILRLIPAVRSNPRPPRWAEALLRVLLPPDDAETVSGDLLEEYRETVFLARPGRRVVLWQVAGFTWRATWLPLIIGLVIGTGLGILNLLETACSPSPMTRRALLLWVVALLGERRGVRGDVARSRRCGQGRHNRWRMTIVAFHVHRSCASTCLISSATAAIGRTSSRASESGFISLRTYANYEYVKLTPVVIALGAIVGSISGAMGGVVSMVARGTRKVTEWPLKTV